MLAPSKTLDLTPSDLGALRPTEPAFAEDAALLVEALKREDPRALARRMKLKPNKAKEIRAWLEAFATGHPVAAAHAYAGEVFRAFGGRRLPTDDLLWAQDRVGVLSGLYGLLRPLDGVVAHRLEMSARVATPRGHNLYAFWGERLTRRINALTAEHEDRALVDLASQEYVKALWPRSLEGDLLEVVFENWKDAARTPNVISTPSRHARGLMARFLVEQRIVRRAQLQAFDAEGYAFVPERSTPKRLVFGRFFQGAS